eukprot:s1820_g16.t1
MCQAVEQVWLNVEAPLQQFPRGLTLFRLRDLQAPTIPSSESIWRWHCEGCSCTAQSHEVTRQVCTCLVQSHLPAAHDARKLRQMCGVCTEALVLSKLSWEIYSLKLSSAECSSAMTLSILLSLPATESRARPSLCSNR